MTATRCDELVDGYLRRLEKELGDLPATRRHEIIDEIHDHIAEERRSMTDETDVDVMNLLDRLGDPAEIAAAAHDDKAPPARLHRFGTTEVLALVLMLLAWPVGVGLLWISKAWTTQQKLLGSLIPPAGYPGVFVVMSTFPRLDAMSSTGPAWVHVATAATLFTISLLLVIAPIGIDVYLATRLRGRSVQREP